MKTHEDQQQPILNFQVPPWPTGEAFTGRNQARSSRDALTLHAQRGWQQLLKRTQARRVETFDAFNLQGLSRYDVPAQCVVQA